MVHDSHYTDEDIGKIVPNCLHDIRAIHHRVFVVFNSRMNFHCCVDTLCCRQSTVFWETHLNISDQPSPSLTLASHLRRFYQWWWDYFCNTSWLTYLTKQRRYPAELKSFISCIPIHTHKQSKYCGHSRRSVFRVSLSAKYILFLVFLWPGSGNIEWSLPQYSVSWMRIHKKPSFLHWKKLMPFFKSALPKRCKKYLFELQKFFRLSTTSTIALK